MADRGQMRHRAILFEASWRTQLSARAILRGRTLKEVFGPGRLPVEGAVPCQTRGNSSQPDVEGGRKFSQRSYRWCGSGTGSKSIQPEWSSKGVSPVLCVPLTASGPSAFPRSRNSLRVVTDRGQMRHRVILFYGVVADSFVCFLARRQPASRAASWGWVPTLVHPCRGPPGLRPLCRLIAR
ncbi:hypothetical protein B0H16DRAFT_1684667 [Mycena metata]|uniref:Uncharacterized protein n=1 Tax=Mycena metata TaxID=1033252 RepID=A0AAD7K1T3_9AGAR|nr:hypothetical protein B0H16DRAFT_1684667 [Mycena metata]